MLELQANFVKQLTSETRESWDKIEINYEYFPWKSSDIEAFDILDELRNVMKTDETWTSCLININNDGKYDFQFGYGMPPMVEKNLEEAGRFNSKRV